MNKDSDKVKEMNDLIIDSLSIKNENVNQLSSLIKHNQSVKTLNREDINELRAKYTNGLIKIQDLNGIVNNPEVFYNRFCSKILIHFYKAILNKREVTI